MRCVHEAQMHSDNSFVTLTYNDENLPYGGTLVKKDWQDFMKRLRWHVKVPVRYYYAGEYGEQTLRPHYHACLFGFDPPDKQVYTKRGEHVLYTSELLTSIWGKGFVSVGTVTFESAGYVARYCMKKVTGKKAEEHYRRVDTRTGEIVDVLPEYADMSRRPGIGAEWLSLYGDETYAHDSVIVNEREVLPPKYYDAKRPEEEMLRVKAARVRGAKAHSEDSTMARLRVREQVKEAQVKSLKRGVE